MHGAKGSNKNRVYQFWLIRIWKEKLEKRKQRALLKKKQKEKERQKVIEEVIGNREQRTFKLAPAPATFRKKEGVVVTLYSIGKKPDKVVEVYEEKSKVGIGPDLESQNKLNQIAKEATTVVASIDSKKKEEAKKPEQLEDKKKSLENDLKKIEHLQTEYQIIVKKNPQAFNIRLVKDPKSKKQINDVLALKIAKEECKQELERVEKALKEASDIKDLEEPNHKIKPEEVAPENQNIKPEEVASKNQNIKPETSIKPNEKDTSTELEKSNIVIKSEKNNTIMKPKNTPLKTGATVALVAGGTLVAFPAVIQKALNQNQKLEKNSKKQATENNPKQENRNQGNDTKEKQQGNNKEEKAQSKNEAAKNPNGNQVEKKEHPKLKLYRSKLEASKEAEILIKSELERQRSYLKKLNEKVGEMEVTRRVNYHFRGLHRLLGNVLTFTLGVFTIPFSRNRIFGTAVGLTLIGNSIRAMRNNLSLQREETYYIEWKNFAKTIYNEKLALKQMKLLVADSLSQVKGLKEDIEREFYGKVPFEEYDEMKTKLEVIELKLIEKQRQIEEMKEKLKQVEEKNKVKVKQMEEISHT